MQFVHLLEKVLIWGARTLDGNSGDWIHQCSSYNDHA